MNGSNSQKCIENIFPWWANSYSQTSRSANVFAMSVVDAMTRASNISDEHSTSCCCLLLKLQLPSGTQNIRSLLSPGKMGEPSAIYPGDYWGRLVLHRAVFFWSRRNLRKAFETRFSLAPFLMHFIGWSVLNSWNFIKDTLIYFINPLRMDKVSTVGEQLIFFI